MNMLSIFIPFGIVVVPLIIIAIFLLNGKGTFFIAGFNTMSKEKRAWYDEKALCRCMGQLLLALALFFALVPVGVFFDIQWLPFFAVAFVLVTVIAFIIYANTGNRFQKSDIPENEVQMMKKPAVRAVYTVAVLAIVMVALSTTTFLGTQEPTINVLDSSMEIKAMYGLDIAFSEITDISLLEKSMSEIGVGIKTNGYRGFGQSLKGHFSLGGQGNAMLFVQSNTSPTILIERSNKQNVYLSFRDGEKTRELFDEMSKVLS